MVREVQRWKDNNEGDHNTIARQRKVQIMENQQGKARMEEVGKCNPSFPFPSTLSVFLLFRSQIGREQMFFSKTRKRLFISGEEKGKKGSQFRGNSTLKRYSFSKSLFLAFPFFDGIQILVLALSKKSPIPGSLRSLFSLFQVASDLS